MSHWGWGTEEGLLGHSEALSGRVSCLGWCKRSEGGTGAKASSVSSVLGSRGHAGLTCASGACPGLTAHTKGKVEGIGRWAANCLQGQMWPSHHRIMEDSSLSQRCGGSHFILKWPPGKWIGLHKTLHLKATVTEAKCTYHKCPGLGENQTLSDREDLQ
jgi:hypothetical protein